MNKFLNKLSVKAAAKINLSLDVTGKLPNGYHSIESVFQTVGIYDIVDLELSPDNNITLECSDPQIPRDEKNIAYKAAALFRELCGLDFGCSIKITKNIPSQAGMGGGSSDGAAVFYILNKLLRTNYNFNDMLPYASKLGADVPFFLLGGTAYAENIGDKLTKLNDCSGKIILIAKGDSGISTPQAYKNIDMLKNPVHPQTKKLLHAINSGDENLYKYYSNIFEQAGIPDDVNIIKSTMIDNYALCSVMTGSGSAVFGQFEDMISAVKCRDILRNNGFYSEICKTVDKSFNLLETRE